MIAGLIIFHYGKNVFYWTSSYLKGYERYCPTSLLLKDSIEQACEKGYEYYDFGESGNLKGVRKFKESFGAGWVELKRYRVLTRMGKLVISVLNKVR